MNLQSTQAPLVLRPHGPFNFIDKWADPVWKSCGVYLWSIPHRDAFLVNYVGQCFGSGTNLERRVWQGYKCWKKGKDHRVDIAQCKAGVRCELATWADGHVQQELLELKPLYRLWLIPLDDKPACDQAENWLVAELCKTRETRQFLANRNLERYVPDPGWPVRIEHPPQFQVFALTVPVSADDLQ